MAALVQREIGISQFLNAGHSAAGQLFVKAVAGEFMFSSATSRTKQRGGEEALGSRLIFLLSILGKQSQIRQLL